ncbi:MAG: hypothetical protein U1F77_12200 [Kiritimatiellia bacterium]
MNPSNDTPDPNDKRFAAHIRKINDPAQWTRPAEELARLGMEFAPAAKLDDDKVSQALWTLIVGLADLRIFLVHTDHLSDRDLYKKLLRELLPYPMPMFLEQENTDCEYDLLGAGTEEDERIWLKFYASDLERHLWKCDNPDRRLFAAACPKADRDELLPKCKKRPPDGGDAPF